MDFKFINNAKIIHFPGRVKDSRENIIKELSEVKISNVPSNLQIITCVDKKSINNSCLIHQLKKSNIDFINAAEDKDISDWTNSKKIPLYYEALQKVNKEYSLLLDGTDVVILGDISNIINDYKIYNKDILFNATSATYPPIFIERIENNLRFGKFNKFNAGCCIGKTKSLIKFYEEGLNLLNNTSDDDEWKDSEQYHLRKVFAMNMDNVWFDYIGRVFQIYNENLVQKIQNFKNF